MKAYVVPTRVRRRNETKKKNIVWKRVEIIISLEGNELEFEVLEKVDSVFSLERCQDLWANRVPCARQWLFCKWTSFTRLKFRMTLESLELLTLAAHSRGWSLEVSPEAIVTGRLTGPSWNICVIELTLTRGSAGECDQCHGSLLREQLSWSGEVN